VKPELQNADRERAIVAWKNLFAGFDAALKLLHPFMPFLTEELWHQLPQPARAKSIALDKYPEARKEWKNARAQEQFALMQEVIVALRNIRAELKLDPKKKMGAEFSSEDAETRSLIESNRDRILRLAILSELKIFGERLPQSGGAVRSTSQFDVRIAYSEAVDVAAEKTRLKKEIDGLQRAVASKEKQLADETFRSRAPEKIIRGLEATLAEQLVELEKNVERLGQL